MTDTDFHADTPQRRSGSDPALTEADRTSDTRFGPRPVPPGHQTARDHKLYAPDARARYGNRPATISTKVIVWGGVALGVAGATAAALRLAEMIGDSGPQRRDPRPARPRPPASYDRDDREDRAYTDRSRREPAADFAAVSAQRDRPARSKPRGNIATDLTRTADDLAQGLDRVAKSIGTAFDSFRGVASQASGIVAEFAGVAQQVRQALRGDDVADAKQPPYELRPEDRANSAREEERRTHRL